MADCCRLIAIQRKVLPVATTLASKISEASPHTTKRVGWRWHGWWRILAVASVFALALFLRRRAVEALPVDFDEDDYLRAGQLYAAHLAAGDLPGVIDERVNYEHPPLPKLLFGVVLVTQGAPAYQNPVSSDSHTRPETRAKVQPLRLFNAVLGALTATLVALFNPLAGFLVAINSWQIKYTSQVMLEALPCLLAALTLLLLRRSKLNGDRWWWLEAVALGLTAAAKYLYAVGAIAALGWLVWRGWVNRRPAFCAGH